MLIVIIGVVVAMIIAHEAAHVLTTLALGGRFDGVFVQHLIAVGVKVRVDGLSRSQVALTLLAAPLAEVAVTVLAWRFYPSAHLLWLMVLCAQWALNLTPWPWFPTDGRKLWLLLHHGPETLAEAGSPIP